MSISAIVIAKNAQEVIAKCLQSVQFADEIILLDIKSTDKTVEIAQKYTNQVVDYKKDSKFVEPVRNYALSLATKSWTLVLDADEEIPATLAQKLLTTDRENSADVFYLARKNIVSGAWMQHTGWWPDYQLRFFKKGLVSWGTQIHSPATIKKGCKIEYLAPSEELAILHHNYKNTKDYINRLDRYTDIEAEQKQALVQNDFVISNSSLLRVFSDDWFRRFFAQEGYKDGVRGFYLSLMQAIYQMTVQMKIFDQLDNQQKLEKNDQTELLKNLRHFQKELNYWVKDLEIKEKNGLIRLLAILKRKFNL